MAHLITTAHHRDTRQIDSLIDDVIFDLQGASKRTVGFSHINQDDLDKSILILQSRK